MDSSGSVRAGYCRLVHEITSSVMVLARHLAFGQHVLDQRTISF